MPEFSKFNYNLLNDQDDFVNEDLLLNYTIWNILGI